MATLAADNTRARRDAEPPVSAHPAFPAIVALWFAALLGLGSLILPAVLLERLATVTGLASLAPSAAPPLGFTARTTIAIGGAILGAVLGLVLARQVAAGHASRPRARFADEAPRRRPISAHDELGEEGLGSPVPRALAAKRRSLAIAEDDAPSRYLSPVPLPGPEPAGAETLEEALELADYVERDEPQAAQEHQEFIMTDQPDFDAAGPDASEAAERQEFIAPPQAGTALPRAFDPLPEPDEKDEAEQALDALPFTPPSLRRASAVADGGNARPTIPQAYEPAVQMLETDPRQDAEPDGFDPDGGDRPLDQLGLVQLAVRLGSAIERRRAWRAAAPGARPEPRASFAVDEEFDAAEAEEAARARADFFGAPVQSAPVAPQPESAASSSAAVRPPAPLAAVDFGEDDDSEADDLAASFSLPLRRRPESDGHAAVPAAFASPGEEHEEDEEDPTAEQEYSSLLAMRNPFRKEEEFVRIEEPEPDEEEIEATVSFPERKAVADTAAARPFDPPAQAAADRTGAAPRNSVDAERELRAALETLQRMSGAA